MERYIGEKTEVIDLQGKTLIPGLVDSHSHFSGTALIFTQGFNISPPPFGSITSIPLLLDELKRYIAINHIKPG